MLDTIDEIKAQQAEILKLLEAAWNEKNTEQLFQLNYALSVLKDTLISALEVEIKLKKVA